jgi:hypothetical protein
LLPGISVIAASIGIARWKQTRGIDVNGAWIAEMQKPNQSPFQVRLDLAASDGTLTVLSPILRVTEPSRRDNSEAISSLSYTTHTPSSQRKAATIRWSCVIEINQLRCTEADDNGVARGTARRNPR